MPNKNYLKGYRLENQLVNRNLEVERFAIRTPGSHSFFDVMTITYEGEIQFIQCKANKLSPSEFKKAVNKFISWGHYIKAINARCYILQHYDKENHWEEITNLVY